MTKATRFLSLFLCFSFFGCSGNKDKRVAVFDSLVTYNDTMQFYNEYGDTSYYDNEDYYTEGEYPNNTVSIPFSVKGGVKTLPVTINGIINVDMIVDTGCSGCLLSLNEAIYLYEKGQLTEDDFIGVGQSMIADGSIVENMVVRLKKIEIGGKLQASDITATVSENVAAPLLLGNEVLDRVRSISIDNEKQCVLFNLY